jgi:hypothetical protein
VTDDLRLSLGEARRLAVRSQHLAGPPLPAGTDGLRQVLRRLRVLQLDPVNVVTRSHLLVLWSRLGCFDRADPDTLLWDERWLFEYWAHGGRRDRVARGVRRRQFGHLLRRDGPRRILSTGESAGRSRRAQARRGRSGLHRAGWSVTPTRGDPRDSATEIRPPPRERG